MAKKPSGGGNNRPGNNNNKPSNNNNNRPSNNNSSRPSGGGSSNSSRPSNNNSSSSSRPGSSGQQQSNRPVQTPQPKHGVKAQGNAYNNYHTALNIRNFADQQHAAGGSVGNQSIAGAYAGGLTPEQQRYLYDYAGGKGYALGDDFKAQFKDAADFNTLPELNRAYNQGSLRSSMVDGKIGHKEILNKMKDRGKNKNDAGSYLRIADRWSSKGGMLGEGVLKNYIGNYEKKNPMLALMNKGDTEGTFFKAMTGDGKLGSQSELYRNALGIRSAGNYMKGDVFGRMVNGELTGRPRVADTTYLGKIATNPNLGSITKAPEQTTPPASGDVIDEGTLDPGFGVDPPGTDTKPAGIEGGINTSGFANTLGIKGRKSSLKASGKANAGTSNLNYARTLGNGFYGSWR